MYKRLLNGPVLSNWVKLFILFPAQLSMGCMFLVFGEEHVITSWRAAGAIDMLAQVTGF